MTSSLTDRTSRDAEAQRLLHLVAALPEDSQERRLARERLIVLYRPFAEQLAGKFASRGGEPLEDLVQVACLALIKAVDGYDASHGVPFVGYAIPYIVGELKRHFRDRTWDVRVPRRLQERRLDLIRATDDLTHELGRSPTVADLAERLGVGEEDVIEGLVGAQAYRSTSLNTPSPDGEGELGDAIGTPDREYERVDNALALRALLPRLPERERLILVLRFEEELTQSQIAARLGISQMHVSRLLAHALRRLREGLLAG